MSDYYLNESFNFFILKDLKYLNVKITFNNYKNKKILRVDDNSDRNEAKLYTNHELYLDRSILKPTGLNEFYFIDLIGTKVYDVNNNFIGVVDEITNNNNLDYLKVKSKNQVMTVLMMETSLPTALKPMHTLLPLKKLWHQTSMILLKSQQLHQHMFH